MTDCELDGIVRRLTELRGGTVTVIGAGPGQGSCFTVRLPTRPTAGSSSSSSRSYSLGRSPPVLASETNGRPATQESLGHSYQPMVEVTSCSQTQWLTLPPRCRSCKIVHNESAAQPRRPPR